MNKFCVLLDKVRSSTCFLSLFHSLPLKDIPQLFSLLFMHQMSIFPQMDFFLMVNKHTVFILSQKIPSWSYFLQAPCYFSSFLCRNLIRKKCLYTWSPVPSVPFFAEFALNKLLVCHFITITPVIIHDCKSSSYRLRSIWHSWVLWTCRIQSIHFSTILLLFFILISWLLPSSLCRNFLGLGLCTSCFSIYAHFLNGFLEKSCFKIPFKHLWLTDFSYS